MSRLLSWFTTSSGKRFTHFCVGATALTVFGVKLAVNGPLLNEVKDVVQLYKTYVLLDIEVNEGTGTSCIMFSKGIQQLSLGVGHINVLEGPQRKGEPKHLSPSLKGLIKQVLKDSNLEKEQRKKIRFFYIVGHEPFHAGGTNSPWGAIIGLPFFFGETEEFRIKDLRVQRKETIDWIIEGQDLLDSLVLTDSAKKFAIMREIYSLNYLEVIVNAFVTAGCIVMPAKFAQRINYVSKAFERLALRQRILRYLLMYIGGYCLYRLLKDPLKHISDEKADRMAAETSIEYLSGGIEFYERTLMKHKALEELANSRFKTYDEKGNENYFLMAPKLPTLKRLENLQKMKKEKVKKAEETNV